MTAAEYLADPCLCGGKPERRRMGALWLLVCSACGKAARERKPGAYAGAPRPA